MELNECYRRKLIKRTRVDENLVKSLKEMSDTDEETVMAVQLNGKNIPSYIVVAYESLRKILEAICLSKGYKILSHVCLGGLVKDFYEDFDLEFFDRVRWIRNGVNYYGKKIDLEQGEKIISKMFKLKKKLISDKKYWEGLE